MLDNRILGLLNKCDIMFEDELISRSLVMSTFSEYLIDLLDNPAKRTGFIYHTGSRIFDVLLTLYIALACLVYDESSPQELVDSLKPGDLVLYNDGSQKTRAEFIGLTDAGFAKIKYIQKSQLTHTIPPKFFYKIKPYLGDATVLDGRGIRANTKAKIDFMQAVFGKNKSEISGVNSKSAIVVCGRNFADSFVDSVQICYEGRHVVEITDLMPVSYFSESNEYRYRSNPGKISPVLKFTNKISFAREMVYEDEEKQVFVVASLGAQIIKTGESELPDLLNRKSLKKTFMSLSITEGLGEFCEMYPDAGVFACTKDMLLSYSLPAEPQGPLMTTLEKQVDNILNREIIEHNAEEIISIEEYKTLRQNIISLRHHVQNDDLIDRFVIESYSLLNYLTNIVFPIVRIECARQTMGLECPSASEKILFLEDIVNKHSGALSDLLSSIFCVINKAYRAIETVNPKEKPLHALIENALQIGTVLVLVPKAYHVDILKTLLPSDIIQAADLHIKTMGAFDHSGDYDSVLCVGLLGTKRFSIFSVYVAPIVDCLIYPHERTLFTHQNRAHEKNELMLNSRSSIDYETTEGYVIEQSTDGDMTGEQEIDNYLEEIAIKTTLQAVSTVSGGASTQADIVRIATTIDVLAAAPLLSKRFFMYFFLDLLATLRHHTLFSDIYLSNTCC